MDDRLFSAIWRKPKVLLALLFGIGLVPFAPGTFATIAAVPAGILLRFFPLWLALGICALLVIAAVNSATEAEKFLKRRDPGVIVIDEFVATLILFVLLPSSMEPLWLLAAVAAFRFFDIAKPWPINIAGRMPGGAGVVADDLVAVIYTILLVSAAFFMMTKVALP